MIVGMADGPVQARYAHTNVVSDDWKRLVAFYVDVFGCEPVGVERDHHGEWIEKVTAIDGARIRGVHLRMPGHGPDGPTLEVFQFDRNESRPRTRLNTPGFAHLAFEVDSMERAAELVLAHGGGRVGAQWTKEVPGEGTITLVYMTDPDGNVVELQQWERS